MFHQEYSFISDASEICYFFMFDRLQRC